MKHYLAFVTKRSLVFGFLAAGFSILGIFLPERQYQDSPLVGGLDIEHILGHIVWGLIIGAASFKIRYFLIVGSFAFLLDLDHLIQFLDIDVFGRMGHSIPFGLLSATVLMIIFGKKDYLLGVATIEQLQE